MMKSLFKSLRRSLIAPIAVLCALAVIAASQPAAWAADPGAPGDERDVPGSPHALAIGKPSPAEQVVVNPSAPDVVGCPITALVNDNSTSGSERAPNLRNRFGRTVYLIKATEMAAAGIGAGTTFSKIGWNFFTAPGLTGNNNLIVYMQNTADTTNTKSTTWTTAITGMTVVHNASTAIPNVTGGWDIALSAGGAFTYSGGGLYVAFDAQYPVGTLSGTTVVFCNSTGLVGGLLGAQGAAAPATLAASSFRPETRLTPSVATILNDASVDFVISYGSLVEALVGPQTVQAVITNKGANPLSNLPVQLTITGADSFSNGQVVPSLAACGGQATVSFAPFVPSAIGSDSVKVTVPADDVASNNANTRPLNETYTLYSYKHPGTTLAGGVGLTGATGAFVSKFKITGPAKLTAVNLEFGLASATTYRTVVYPDSGSGTPGLSALYEDASDQTVGAPGPVTTTLPTPLSLAAGTYYAGIEQTNTTNASLSFDNEAPIRGGSFYLATPYPATAWFDFAPGNNFKLNIGVTLVQCVTASDCDDSNPCTNDFCDGTTGTCTHTNNTEPCNDSNACTTNDVCSAGTCVGGGTLNCDDGNACTLDSCDSVIGCIHTAVNCDDGNPCTTDSCAQGLVAPACVVNDNGGGTVNLPPAGCDYLSPQDVHDIINGLPAGTTIQFAANHHDFLCGQQAGTPSNCSFVPPPGVCDQPGGTLGGNEECAQSTLALNLHGTGVLTGWNRSIPIPVEFETHVGPHPPGAPVQSFNTEMFMLQGQITGDPDFDLLRIVAGNSFGLPSPGHTTLRTQGNGTWTVDSFFDITYRIDFVGHAGGHVGGMSGSTTGTIRMQTGSGIGCVHVPINCDDNNPCTLDSCDPTTGACVHTPVTCNDSNACTADSCDPKTGGCVNTAIDCNDGQACTTDSCDPSSGCVHSPLNCDDGNACTNDSCIQAVASNPCVVTDNGGGTVTLPPAGCSYLSPSDVHQIINGLPAGTTIQLGAIHKDFICRGAVGPPAACDFPPGVTCEQPGGALGGNEECADSNLNLTLHGTGTLAGFDRLISMPISFETHVGPRTPGQPVQSFPTDMFRLQGQLPPGDPDFDLLRISAGSAFGMPSPGHTTLRQVGTNWQVDSFFDITYRIDFIGHAGGHIGGMSGSTTATIRMQTGDGVGCVHSPVNCDDSNPCTLDSCDPLSGCVHTPVDCNDGQACTVDSCDPTTGACVHSALNCDDGNACTADSCIQAVVANPCVVTDNGGGTVTLPPAGCAYLSPDQVHQIINGLPAGTTIQFGTIHRDFICKQPPSPGSVCDFGTTAGCDQPGGALGGREECADSQLSMNLNGTGVLTGWTRQLSVPISFETHVGPRTPGAPVQSFPTDMFRLQGQLPPGDPDFDLLRITAGDGFGLPSPGHTTLTHLAGQNWQVDSFFDITYRIDFVGHPGGHIGGMSGSTTGTIRMQTGNGVGCVHTPITCNDSNVCTNDSCDPASGCVFANNTSTCDDGNNCTTGDVCGGGTCAGTPITAPPETANVLVAADKATYSWSPAPFATRYDVVRGTVLALPVGPGGGDETCFDNLGGPSLNDPTPPAVGSGFFYLSRGENTCGNGTYGTQGFHGAPGAPRTTTTCP